jgi:hypothetical protein
VSLFALRALVGTAGIAAVALGLVVAKSIEETRLRAVIAGHDACAAAVANDGLDVSASRCPPAVAAAHRDQLRARTCDAALAGGETFGMRSACSTPVKTVVAERDAARGERDRALTEIDRLRKDQSAAVARAEARGRAEAVRTHDLETRLEGPSPLPDSGLARCDAECLRRLAG